MLASGRFALHRPEILDALTRGEEKIARLMAPQSKALAGGKTLIEADREHKFVYRLRQGWAGRVRALPDGRSQFILIFLPGDLFAIKSMFTIRHTDAVETLSDAVVEQIDYRVLRAAYDADPDIAIRCTWQVMEEERRLHSWIVSLGRGSAEERLARLLLDFRARLALSGSIGQDSLVYVMPMTQAQMADHLGITAVHVSRVLRSLRASRLADIRGQKVTIYDLPGLAQLAYALLDSFERIAPEFLGEAVQSAE